MSPVAVTISDTGDIEANDFLLEYICLESCGDGRRYCGVECCSRYLHSDVCPHGYTATPTQVLDSTGTTAVTLRKRIPVFFHFLFDISWCSQKPTLYVDSLDTLLLAVSCN